MAKARTTPFNLKTPRIDEVDYSRFPIGLYCLPVPPECAPRSWFDRPVGEVLEEVRRAMAGDCAAWVVRYSQELEQWWWKYRDTGWKTDAQD